MVLKRQKQFSTTVLGPLEQRGHGAQPANHLQLEQLKQLQTQANRVLAEHDDWCLLSLLCHFADFENDEEDNPRALPDSSHHSHLQLYSDSDWNLRRLLYPATSTCLTTLTLSHTPFPSLPPAFWSNKRAPTFHYAWVKCLCSPAAAMSASGNKNYTYRRKKKQPCGTMPEISTLSYSLTLGNHSH